ncbi:MAG TPA: HAD family hydrolase [Anaerolineae bacterium]|nr:HAD family hydrolase [Anaerolineae bacterium]
MSSETQPGRYRLVAVDLDGSLQPNGALHEADAAALRTAHAAGVKVVLVSALPPQLMHRYWAQLGLGAPIIALNGALVYDFPSHRPVAGQPLEAEQLQRIMQAVHETAPQAAVALQQREVWVTNHLGRAAKEMIQRTGVWPSYMGDLASRLGDEIYQVWVSADAGPLEALEAALTHAGLSLARYTDPARLVMQAASVSRGWALSSLASQMEVAPHEVMAIGGGGQDRSMLQAAAFAVLVSDMGKELEPVADVERMAKTPGVAEALARYLTVEESEIEAWPSVEP